jgi:hypothetical protein
MVSSYWSVSKAVLPIAPELRHGGVR